MSLSEQDMDELACRCHITVCPLHNDLAEVVAEYEVAELVETVEQIVARHVAAALTEAADAIEQRADAFDLDHFAPRPSSAYERGHVDGCVDGLNEAAHIFRAHIPK